MVTKAKGTDRTSGQVEKKIGASGGAAGGGVFYFTCYDKDGNVKWTDAAKNLVTNQGLQDMNAKYFKGSGYSAAWYIGLVDNAGFTAYDPTDTMASHTGWTETTSYSGSNRATATFGTATTADPSVIDNNASQASFSITGTVTVRGAFLTATQDKTTNTGVLFSVADFEAPGNRSVVSGDTLTVSYSFSLADA
jgi:hypothetical protein